MEVSYAEAREVEKIADEIIPKYHEHLKDATIIYLFVDKNWKRHGKVIYGSAEKLSAKWSFLTEADFIITINRLEWLTMSKESKEALVDHELSHCGIKVNFKTGEESFTIKEHSFEDFTSVIKRHGLWTDSLADLDKAKEQYEQISIEETKKISKVS